MKKVTMSDIAKAAHVSKGTVSNALNGNDEMVSAEKKEEIRRLAEDMGYRKVNHLIRFVIFERLEHAGKRRIDNAPNFQRLYQAVGKECRRQNYHVALNHIREEDKKQGFDYIRSLADCDGLIILGWELESDDLSWLRNYTKLPFVIADASFTDPAYDFVTSNNIDAAYQMTRRMIDCGHRHIGCIDGGRLNVFAERMLGYQYALMQKGIDYDRSLICHIDRTQKSEFTSEIGEFLDRLSHRNRPMPTAFLCCDDRTAVSFMAASIKRGYAFSLAGFDNLPLCLDQTPPLTSAATDYEYMGEAAARRIIEKIERMDERTEKIYVEPSIYFRESIRELNRNKKVKDIKRESSAIQ
jgi:LacI family transcriptional regulator